MKHKLLFTFILCALFSIELCQAQITLTLTGTVTDTNQDPIPGTLIFVKGMESISTQTDMHGNYKLEGVPSNSIIIFSYLGATTVQYEIKGDSDFILNMTLVEDDEQLTEVASVVSPLNYWTGAKLGFNIIGNEDENLLVGSASITILDAKKHLNIHLNPTHSLSLVGSVGSFSFKEKDIAKLDDQVKKLAQSINGLSLGFGFTNESEPKQYWGSEEENTENEVKNMVHRGFYITGLRFNNIEDVGVEDKTVNFWQWATTAGYEVEFKRFFNRSPLTISASTNLFVFNQNRYIEVFNEERNSLISFEGTIIIPFSPKVGFLANGAFEIKNSPVYTLGVIFR